MHVLLKREGYVIDQKKLFRLYREEKLAVRRRGGRKRAIGTRAPMLVPMAANDRWSLDFVSDQFTDGRRFRILADVDDCTRECLTLAGAGIDRLMIERGKPKMVVSDNGSELTSNAILTWAAAQGARRPDGAGRLCFPRSSGRGAAAPFPVRRR
jgi:putative transposase